MGSENVRFEANICQQKCAGFDPEYKLKCSSFDSDYFYLFQRFLCSNLWTSVSSYRIGLLPHFLSFFYTYLYYTPAIKCLTYNIKAYIGNRSSRAPVESLDTTGIYWLKPRLLTMESDNYRFIPELPEESAENARYHYQVGQRWHWECNGNQCTTVRGGDLLERGQRWSLEEHSGVWILWILVSSHPLQVVAPWRPCYDKKKFDHHAVQPGTTKANFFYLPLV